MWNTYVKTEKSVWKENQSSLSWPRALSDATFLFPLHLDSLHFNWKEICFLILKHFVFVWSCFSGSNEFENVIKKEMKWKFFDLAIHQKGFAKKQERKIRGKETCLHCTRVRIKTEREKISKKIRSTKIETSGVNLNKVIRILAANLKVEWIENEKT